MKIPEITVLPEVRELVERALQEDIGRGDVTSDALIGRYEKAAAKIVCRQDCILSGVGVAALVFRMCDSHLDIQPKAADGSSVAADRGVLTVKGKARSILAAERVALNFLQRMSGIASYTHRFVKKVKPYGVQVLDTRKTTPTLRVFEKYAVLCGGGSNHRMGLYDRILIKDNHRISWKKRCSGGLAEAVKAARKKNPNLPIEVEVETEKDLRDVLRASPDWILLDNMPVHRMSNCVKICKGRCKIEASGGISLATVAKIARTGIDAVSIGALTHSPPAADFSLEFFF